jgi:hypothetical protein
MAFALDAARRFRAKADECRRRAAAAPAAGNAAMLLALAAEYENRAAEAEALHRSGDGTARPTPAGR